MPNHKRNIFVLVIAAYTGYTIALNSYPKKPLKLIQKLPWEGKHYIQNVIFNKWKKDQNRIAK